MARKNEEDHACCRGHRERGAGKLLFGIFILIIGLSWLGNEMGLWKINLPWLPLAVTIIGISMVANWLLKKE